MMPKWREIPWVTKATVVNLFLIFDSCRGGLTGPDVTQYEDYGWETFTLCGVRSAMLLTLPIPVLEIYGRQSAGQQRVWPDRTFEASPPFSCTGLGQQHLQIVSRDVKKVEPAGSCHHF